MPERLDAVVIGSGPNGLVAALELARAGWRVRVVEAADRPGGGTRSEELTLPGFTHDVCSAIHPLGIASPALRNLDLAGAGVQWIHPDAPLGHAVAPGRSALLERSLEDTAAALGPDRTAWRRLLGPSVRAGLPLSDTLLAPLDLPPAHPVAAARFGLVGVRSAASLARRFDGDLAPALLAGLAAHSVLDLDAAVTGGFGLLLGALGHVVGWPMARGGSQSIADALVTLLRDAGGEVHCGERIDSLAQLPPARAVLCDVTPRQLVHLAGDAFPARYRRALGRYRYGPGVFKVDWALDGPVPWADPALLRAGTVHLGGTAASVQRSEHDVTHGRHPDEPFVLLAQQSLFDPTRAPEGHHTLWGYCHVPHGSDVDMTARIEARIEAFAPGFRDRVLARHCAGPAQVQAHNANYVGGDITGGMSDLRQFVFRPVASLRPWATAVPGLYLCSSSTPPGAGVHGMCGRAAARTVLSDAARGRL
jgi:phytoene dehydrogenase-like protein